MSTATRNISITISANVRRYTDGLKRAETATRQFQKSASVQGRAMGRSSESVKKAARDHSVYEKGLHASMRAQGMAIGKVNSYSGAVRNGNRALNAAGQATGAYAKSMTFLKTAALQAVGAMTGFFFMNSLLSGIQKGFAFVTESVTAFDTAITESMAIAKEFGPGVRAQFEEAARAQSKLSAFNPAELAEGYYQLLSAGLETNAAIEATAVVANFAQAGVMELEQASELAAQATAALGLDAGNATDHVAGMTRVTDSFVAAALASTATVEEFGEAMTNKFGTAVSLANREVEEATTILMAYARVGIKGRVGGTQASIWFRDIQKAAINNGEAMKEMGIEVFDAQGQVNDLVTIAKQMGSAFGSMSTEELRITLKQLGFADRAVHAILPIIATSADTWDEYYDAQQNAGGASAKIAARQLLSITNQLSLMKQALSTVAEQAGRSGLNLLYKGWERLKGPIQEIWENLQVIGKTLVEGLRPGIELIGGAFYGALQGALQVIQGITNVMSVKWAQPFIQGFLAVASTAYVGAKAFAVYKAAMLALGGIKTVVATISAAHATWNSSVLLTDSITKQSAATQAWYALSAKIHAATSATAWLGANGKIVLSLKAVGAAFATAAKAAYRFLMAVPWLIPVAAVGALLLKIKNLNQEFDQLGTTAMQDIEDEYNMESLDERAKSIEEQVTRVNDLKQAYREGAGESDNGFAPWAFLETGVNNNAGARAIEQAEEDIIAAQAEWQKYQDAVETIAQETGSTVEVAARRVQDSGFSDIFIDEDVDSKAYQDAIGEVTESMDGIVDVGNRAGLSMEQMAGMSGEAFEEMMEDASGLQEGFNDIFKGLVDPSAIMENITEVNEAIATGFGGSFSGVFDSLNEELEAAAKESSESAFESYDRGIEEQVKRLNDRKDALDPPRGAELTDPEKDAIDARKDAIDDEIESLKEGKRERDSFDSAVSAPGLQQWLTKLKETSEESKQFTDSLQTLRNKLLTEGDMDSSMVNAIVTEFAEMGPEALPLIDEFANATGAKFTAMAEQVQAAIAAMNPNVEVTLDQLIKEQQGNLSELQGMTKGFLDFSSLTAGSLTVDEIQAFAGLGPEFAALVPQMVDQINAAGPPGSQAAQMVTQQMIDTIRTQLDLAEFGEGAIPEAIVNAMAAAQAAAAAGADGMTQAIATELQNDVQILRDQGGVLGTEMIDAWYLTALARRAELGDPFAISEINQGQVIAREDGWYLNGRQIDGAIGKADGGIVEFFGNGGVRENHKPQIAKSGTMRVWAEPETGGEAYIPLGSSKRNQAMPVLAEVARRFGMDMGSYANGGISTPGSAMVGGGQWGTPGAVQVMPVPVPVESKNVTNFNGPIQGVKMEDAERYAERKRRQNRLAGGRR